MPPLGEETEDSQHAVAAEKQTTSRIAAPMEGRQKTELVREMRQKTTEGHMGTAKKVRLMTK